MIDNNVKDKVIGITSFCDTNEKLKVLTDNISIIRERFPEYKIALHANYPLSSIVQRSVDMYIYEDLNHTEEDKWIYYWNIITDDDIQYFDKKFYYSIQDTGFSVFQQIKSITKHLIDYKWVMLINYDTSVEEIKIEDYSEEHDLTVHYFPDHKAYSLIIMFYSPQTFYNRIATQFTYENWVLSRRKDQLNEERFFDMVNSSGINTLALDYKVSEKISGEPDYLKPNAPENEYFTNYLVCNQDGILEFYLWGLKKDIKNIEVFDELGNSYDLENQNENGAFMCSHEPMVMPGSRFYFLEINENKIIYQTNGKAIILYVKRGYRTEPI